jgi:RNA polymerase sigma factor (sigma-70 family)
MDPERLLLDSLEDLERIARFVCRRGALHENEVEDFTSSVKLKLIENDYAILRKFEGRSSLRTYLTVVVHRLLMDYRNHLLGKWRPSAEAKRLGDAAVLLETMMHRDRLTFEEAAGTIETSHPELTRDELQRLAEQLPPRSPRRRDVTLDDLPYHPTVPADSIEQRAEANETALLRARANRVIRRAIDGMPDADRVVLRMRFEAGLSVAEIARLLRTEAAPLYRQIYRHLAAIRSDLERAGICAGDVERLIGSSGSLDFGLAGPSEVPK